MTKRGRPSLARRRHELILSQVRRAGGARVADLAAQLDVSEMTVRRDLDALQDAGLLVKVHGGATVRYEHSTDEPGFEAKSRHNRREKTAIAASAAAMVGPGAAIGISAGTTTVLLASELVNVPKLTVVTNSVPVSDVFQACPRADRTVVLVGGERSPSDALVGPIAVSSLGTFNLDTVFMGVHGMHEQAGFSTPNLLEADINRAFVDSTGELVVLADHTKWGVRGLATFADLDEATVCITDDQVSDHARSILNDRVGRLVLSSPDLVSDQRSA